MRMLLAVIALATASLAQEARPPVHHGGAPEGARVVTMTRPMATMSGLENELDAALAKGDHAALDKLVKDDFSLWTPNATGDPIARDEWLRKAAGDGRMDRRHLAVESFSNGDVYVANFVALPTAGSIGHLVADKFTVDVWIKAGDGYQLAARYQAPTRGVKPLPRPSGKE